MKTVKEGTWALYRGTGRCEIYTGNNYRQGGHGIGVNVVQQHASCINLESSALKIYPVIGTWHILLWNRVEHL